MAQPTGSQLRNVIQSRMGQAWQELVMVREAVQQTGTASFTAQNLTDITALVDDMRDAADAVMQKIADSSNPN